MTFDLIGIYLIHIHLPDQTKDLPYAYLAPGITQHLEKLLSTADNG